MAQHVDDGFFVLGMHSPSMTLDALQDLVEKEVSVPKHAQKLAHNGVDLKRSVEKTLELQRKCGLQTKEPRLEDILDADFQNPIMIMVEGATNAKVVEALQEKVDDWRRAIHLLETGEMPDSYFLLLIKPENLSKLEAEIKEVVDKTKDRHWEFVGRRGKQMAKLMLQA